MSTKKSEKMVPRFEEALPSALDVSTPSVLPVDDRAVSVPPSPFLRSPSVIPAPVKVLPPLDINAEANRIADILDALEIAAGGTVTPLHMSTIGVCISRLRAMGAPVESDDPAPVASST